MKLIQNLIGGLAGAIALTGLHQCLKYLVAADAPRIDKIGEQGLIKLSNAAGLPTPMDENLFAMTLVGDLVSNTLFYSFIGLAKRKQLLKRGIILGAAAGIGALTLTKPLGLGDRPVNKTHTTQILTVSLYLIGGLITALTIQALRNNKRNHKSKNHKH